MAAGMESGFGGTSGSDGHGRGNKNLEAEKGLGQGFDLTKAQHLTSGWLWWLHRPRVGPTPSRPLLLFWLQIPDFRENHS